MEVVIKGGDLPDVRLCEWDDIDGCQGYNVTLRQAAMMQWPDHALYDLSISWDTRFAALGGANKKHILYKPKKKRNCILL